MEIKTAINHTAETIELSCVIKIICDQYKLKPEDLRVLPTIDHLLSITDKVRFKKRLYLKIPIPAEIAPEGEKPYLHLTRQRSIDNMFADFYGDKSVIGKLEFGLGEFALRHPSREICFWAWKGGLDYYPIGTCAAYFIHKDDVFFFTSFFKRIKDQNRPPTEAPILPSEMLSEIYKNSIGFLLKGKTQSEQYKKYHIPYKRGILLSGRPGCGKTLTCKWLRELCEENDLAYRIVTMEDYREAQNRSRVRSLFKLRGGKGGIIFFDDMDVMVEDRRKGNSHTLSTFLSELDGLDAVEGVVYVFTTNYMKELDEAFVRPGRIDLWLPFNVPSTKLRQKFVDNRFDKEILDGVDSAVIVKKSKDYSFAELEEIRKLFCMDLIDGKELNLKQTFVTFDKHRKDFEERAQILGFSKLTGEENDEDECYVDDGYPEDFPIPPRMPRRFR